MMWAGGVPEQALSPPTSMDEVPLSKAPAPLAPHHGSPPLWVKQPSEAQSRSAMLHHQAQHLNSAYGGSASSLCNRKCEKDSNFNSLPGTDDEGFSGNEGGGDENRNQVRPRTLTLGRDPPGSSTPPSGFHNPGLMSPRSRLPCWSHLEPLPEVDSGDDVYGRVPPDGAEEKRMEEEDEGRLVSQENAEEQKVKGDQDLDDEWGDSDSESEFSGEDSEGQATLMGGWDRVGVGEPRSNQEGEATNTNTSRRRSCSRPPLADLLEDAELLPEQSSDTDGELMDAVWTLRDRERFKAQEMEKHQVQLTMYRRLALIRWVRTLQARVHEQQNRLQSSFDVILTHRKELLRVGAVSMASHAPTAAVGQS